MASSYKVKIMFFYPSYGKIFKSFFQKGGSDFKVPLSILQITENSIADRAGLKTGDAIIKINNQETSWMEHNRAKMELIRSGKIS